MAQRWVHSPDLVDEEAVPKDLAQSVATWEWEERSMFGLHLGLESQRPQLFQQVRPGIFLDDLIQKIGHVLLTTVVISQMHTIRIKFVMCERFSFPVKFI